MAEEGGAADINGNADVAQSAQGAGFASKEELISFSNLENVVKQIIRKFKQIEAHVLHNEISISALKKDIETRALLSQLESERSMLHERVDTVAVDMRNFQALIDSMHTALDRQLAHDAKLEKKIDLCVKDKLIQDRYIRETQELVLDKVSVAELNMFEAKLAGYVTKLEHQGFVQSLSSVVRHDVVERIGENMKAMSENFDNYARSSMVENLLQEIRRQFRTELRGFASEKDTFEKIDLIHKNLSHQLAEFEFNAAATQKEQRGLADRLTDVHNEITLELNGRAMAYEVPELKAMIRQCALKVDTESALTDLLPKVSFCVENVKAFDEAIMRLDEVMLDKAGKYDIEVLKQRIDELFEKAQRHRT